jgi:molecular chaperone DnaK (HSP70)
MVSMQGKMRYMGDEAAVIQKSNFKNTPLNLKRLLGRKFREAEVRAKYGVPFFFCHKLSLKRTSVINGL